MNDNTRRKTWFIFFVLATIILILCGYIWIKRDSFRHGKDAVVHNVPGQNEKADHKSFDQKFSSQFVDKVPAPYLESRLDQPGTKTPEKPTFSGDLQDPFVMPVKDGRWRSVDPGGSGGLLTAAMHPAGGTLLVSSDMWHSLLRSRDSGRSFHPIAPEGRTTVTVLAPHPDKPAVWYAGLETSSQTGIYRSRDDGESWQLVNPRKKAAYTNCFGLVLTVADSNQDFAAEKETNSATTSDTLLWYIRGVGPQISFDGGRTFQDFSRGLDSENCKGPFLQAGENKNATVYIACQDGLYQRKLSGERWNRVSTLPADKVVSLAFDRKKQWVWVSFQKGRVYRKDAAGWKKIANPLPRATLLRTHRKKPGWIWGFSHGRAGLFRSRNGGETWQWLTRILLYNGPHYQNNVPRVYRYRNKIRRDLLFIDPQDPDRLMLGQSLASNNGGKSWHYSPMDYFPEKNSWRGNGLTLLTCYQAWWDNTNPNRAYLGFSDTGLMRTNDRGRSVEVLWEQNYPDIYSLGYWSRTLLNTSGSCMAFAVDPERPSTQYYAMSGKGGSSASGMLFKTTDDGRNWDPVMPETSGLPEGIITDLVLLPGKGFHQRQIYALVNAMTDNHQPRGGLYLSRDSGASWSLLAGVESFSSNLPLMDLDYCRDKPEIMYLASTFRTGKRPGKNMKRIPEKPGRFGGIFKSTDGGKSWNRAGDQSLACSVEVAVHPRNPDMVYAAVAPGKITQKNEKPYRVEGGIYRSRDGGKTWKSALENQSLPGKGNLEPTSIAVNPALPRIVYAAVENAGVLRSMDNGTSWQSVDWEHLKRYQSSYHTLSINPHDPAEFYLALFGNSFLAYRDPVADKALKSHWAGKNLVRNSGFELKAPSGRPVYWSWRNSSSNEKESSILSLAKAPGKKGRALRVQMDSDRHDNGITWLETRLSPFAAQMVRSRTVEISYDIYAEKAKFRDRPVLSLVEEKNDRPRLTAELPACLAYTDTPYKKVRITGNHDHAGKWKTITGTARISKDANAIRLVFYATSDIKVQKYYIDNVKLSVTE